MECNIWANGAKKEKIWILRLLRCCLWKNSQSYFEKVNLINSERCLQILEESSPGLSLAMGRSAGRLPSDKCCYMKCHDSKLQKKL